MSVYEHLWAVKKVNNLTYKPLIAVGAVCRLSLEIQAITVNDKKLIVAGAGVGSSHATETHTHTLWDICCHTVSFCLYF